LAIIVDKVQKRRDIALSCHDLLLEKGIRNLTIAEVAKTAGIGKGSVYDYFTNKEDIVFEIIRSHIEEYHQKFNQKFDEKTTTLEKIFLLFDFILSNNDEFIQHHKIYKEYMSITLGTNNEAMHKFNIECTSFKKEILLLIIEEGIKKGEIMEQSKNLINGLLAAEKGFIITSWTEDKYLKEEFRTFLNTIFTLVEVKNEK